MSGGPYSRERRTASLKGFGYLALIGGPAGVLLAVVMALGIWPAPDDGPVDIESSASAGASLEIDEFDPAMLWGVPADLDLAGVTCTGNDGSLEADGAPGADGSAQRESVDGVAMTRLLEREYDDTVTCDGGGLTEFGYEVVDGPDRTQGAWFFGVFGVLTTLLGLLARRLTREA